MFYQTNTLLSKDYFAKKQQNLEVYYSWLDIIMIITRDRMTSCHTH